MAEQPDAVDLIHSCLGNTSSIAWIGGIGVEDRSIVSLAALAESDHSVSAVLGVDYSAKTYDRVSDSSTRARRNWRSFETYSAHLSSEHVQVRAPSPHSSLAFRQALAQVLQSTVESRDVLVDVSSLTRPHLFGLASAIVDYGLKDAARSWHYAYTSPASYDPLGTSSSGWARTVLAPTGPGARLGNAGNSVGVILLGHEDERLAAAMAEFSPSRGTVVLASTQDAPEFGRRAALRHRAFIKWWSLRENSKPVVALDVDDTDQIRRVCQLASIDAMESDSPVVIYPFGPKVLCFAAAIATYSTNKLRSWYVYPVPSRYSIDHAEGVRALALFDKNLDPIGRSLLN